jgi:hypothetical protein
MLKETYKPHDISFLLDFRQQLKERDLAAINVSHETIFSRRKAHLATTKGEVATTKQSLQLPSSPWLIPTFRQR